MARQSSTLAWKIPWTEEPWQAAVHGVTKSRAQLSDFTFTFHFHALEKEMATHSGVLAWRIPGMGEPGGLHPVGCWWGRTESDTTEATQQQQQQGVLTCYNVLEGKQLMPDLFCSYSLNLSPCPRNVSFPRKPHMIKVLLIEAHCIL